MRSWAAVGVGKQHPIVRGCLDAHGEGKLLARHVPWKLADRYHAKLWMFFGGGQKVVECAVVASVVDDYDLVVGMILGQKNWNQLTEVFFLIVSADDHGNTCGGAG